MKLRHIFTLSLILAALSTTLPVYADSVCRAYVAAQGSNSISVIDTATKNVSQLPMSSAPNYTTGVATTPNGVWAYVTNASANEVEVINVPSNTVTAVLSLSSPTNVAITPNGAWAYVVGGGVNLWAINTATNTVVATIPINWYNYNLAITPDSKYVWVVSANGPIEIVDATPTSPTFNTIIDSFDLISTTSIAFSPVTKLAYALSYYPRVVNVVDADPTSATYKTTLLSIPLYNYESFEVRISPDNTMVYVASFGSHLIRVIDARPTSATFNQIVRTLYPGAFPYGLAFTPDGSQLYVNNYLSGNVAVLDLASGTTVANVPVGLYNQYIDIACTQTAYVNTYDQVVNQAAGAADMTLNVFSDATDARLGNEGKFLAGGLLTSGSQEIPWFAESRRSDGALSNNYLVSSLTDTAAIVNIAGKNGNYYVGSLLPSTSKISRVVVNDSGATKNWNFTFPSPGYSASDWFEITKILPNPANDNEVYVVGNDVSTTNKRTVLVYKLRLPECATGTGNPICWMQTSGPAQPAGLSTHYTNSSMVAVDGSIVATGVAIKNSIQSGVFLYKVPANGGPGSFGCGVAAINLDVNYSRAYTVAQKSDGSFFVYAGLKPTGVALKFYMSKFTSSGVWSMLSQIDNPGDPMNLFNNFVASDLKPIAGTSGFMVVGNTGMTASLLKLDANGAATAKISNFYPVYPGSSLNSATQSADMEIILGGYTQSTLNNQASEDATMTQRKADGSI